MTEDNAKTKWCPMVRLSSDGPLSFDNRGNDHHEPNCIASDCMMWQPIKEWWSKGDKGRSAPPVDDEGWTHHVNEGYCGLAK